MLINVVRLPSIIGVSTLGTTNDQTNGATSWSFVESNNFQDTTTGVALPAGLRFARIRVLNRNGVPMLLAYNQGEDPYSISITSAPIVMPGETYEEDVYGLALRGVAGDVRGVRRLLYKANVDSSLADVPLMLASGRAVGFFLTAEQS